MDISLSITSVFIIDNKEVPARESWCQASRYRSPKSETHRTRGELFALTTISSQDHQLDLAFLAKQAFDTLTQEYFSHTEGGITQALAASLDKTKEKIYLLTKKPKQAWDTVSLGLASAVIWGNILYFAHLGENQITLLRGGELVSFPFTSLGSENLENNDIVILSCPLFLEKFGQKKVISTLTQPPENWHDLFQKEMAKWEQVKSTGAIFLQIREEEVPSEEEIIDIGMVTKQTRKSALTDSVKKVGESLKDPLTKYLTFPRNLFVKKPEIQKPQHKILATLLLSFLLLASASFTYFYRNYRQKRQQQQQLIQQVQLLLEQGATYSAQDPQAAGQCFLEAANLLSQIHDDKQTQQLAQELNSVLNTAYHFTKLPATKTEAWPQEAQGRLYVLRENGLTHLGDGAIILPRDNTWQEIISIDGFATDQGYNLYLLDRKAGQIHKYLALPMASPSGRQNYSKHFNYFTSVVDLSEAVDFSIDGALFVLYRNGDLLKFLGGEPQPFQLSGFYPELSGAQIIFTAPEANHLYIVKDSKILVFNKEGAYQKGWLLETKEGITNLFVDEAEGKLWFDSGGQLYLAEIK